MLDTIVHTLHVILAGAWLGGVVFTTTVVSPALKSMGWDEAEEAWAILEPVMRAWSGSEEVPTYPAGTWGPEEADELLERDGREWRRP